MKAAGSLPQRNTVRKLAAGRLRSGNSALYTVAGQTRFTALNSRHVIVAMTTPTESRNRRISPPFNTHVVGMTAYSIGARPRTCRNHRKSGDEEGDDVQK